MKLTFEKAVYALIYLPLSLLAIIVTELVFFIVKQIAKITAACKRNKIFVICLFLFSIALISCNVQKPLHQSGPYVIEWRQGNLSRLQGVRGVYEFTNDTLKVGDTIQVTVMRRRK